MDNGASSYRRFRDNGDESGLVEIIRDYKDGLILYLTSIVGNIQTAEELAEDTFVLLGTKKPRDKGGSSFKTWLYTIGKNLAVDHMRKFSKQREVPLDDMYDVSDRENIENNHIRSEDKRQLLRAMKQLKEEYRQVLYLVYFENFSNTEAAAIMGKSERQIRNLLYRSKETLRKILEKEGFSYEGI